MLFTELENEKFESSPREEEHFLIVIVVVFFRSLRSFPTKMVSSYDGANSPVVITNHLLLTLNSSSKRNFGEKSGQGRVSRNYLSSFIITQLKLGLLSTTD